MLDASSLCQVAPGEVPKYYRKVEIKYSKFGIEDFDFGFYNRTQYSGLETDILNSYTNSLLQALHYTSPIRTVAKGHICVNCKKESCLLCEAGFLFRMLEDAKGINCQASNFSRAFSATPQGGSVAPAQTYNSFRARLVGRERKGFATIRLAHPKLQQMATVHHINRIGSRRATDGYPSKRSRRYVA